MRSLFKNIFKIVKKVIESLIQLVEIMFFFRPQYKKLFSENPQKEALIIGNGPSFEREIKFFNDVKKKNNIEISCVNSFVLTTYFREIKPANYFLIDPYYFNMKNYNFVKDLLNSLIINTKWDMNFYFPRYYLNSFFINKLLENSYIKLIPLNNIPMLGGFNGLKFFLFSHNLGNPVYQNVLIAAIFIAIQKKNKKIKIIGSDHSWLENIKVLPSNIVILDDKHFIEKDKNITILKNEDGSNKELHVFLKQLSVMFKEYHTLKSYAKKQKIKIINITRNSFIDAFSKEIS